VGEERESQANDPVESTDTRIPEPLGLSTYVQLMGEWSKGMVSEPYLLGLIQSKNFGDKESSEFLAGADQLWGLVPPIDAPDVAEAELQPAAARALGLALTLQGQQALHHHLPTEGPSPVILTRVAEMVTVVNLILEGHEDSASPAEKHLASLQAQLTDRSVDTSRLAERKEDVRDAVLNRRHKQERERRERREREAEEAKKAAPRKRSFTSAVPLKIILFMAASVVLAITLLNTLSPEPSGGLPAASEYTEVPVLGIIRHPDVIYILVKPEWLIQDEASRRVGARRLFERLSKESAGNVVKLVFQTRAGKELAYVTAQRVRWLGPMTAPQLPPPAPPAKVKAGTDQSTASGDP